MHISIAISHFSSKLSNIKHVPLMSSVQTSKTTLALYNYRHVFAVLEPFVRESQCKEATRSPILNLLTMVFSITLHFIFLFHPAHCRWSIAGCKGTSDSSASFVQQRLRSEVIIGWVVQNPWVGKFKNILV